MRNLILLAAGLAALTGMTHVAAAAAADPGGVRIIWDQSQKKWLSTEGMSPARLASLTRDRIPREMVDIDTHYGLHTIIVDTSARRLYFVYDIGKAIEYGIAVGREGFEWSGADTISRKAEWPTWKPPTEMIARERKTGRNLPEVMHGGLDNPLGARALYIGMQLYRIHGTNDPSSIGKAVSSGCIRMTNDDIIDLFDRVHLGTRVVVLKPTKTVVKFEPQLVPAPAVTVTATLSRTSAVDGGGYDPSAPVPNPLKMKRKPGTETDAPANGIMP